MIKIIKDLIMDKWNDWDLGKRPKGIECLLLNYAKLNFIIFKKGAKTPCLLIKVSKDDRLEAEFRNLNYINTILPGTTPKPYELLQLNGYFVLAEEFIQGSKLLYQSDNEDSIRTAFRQLIEFHKKVMGNSLTLTEEIFETLISAPISKFMRYNSSDVIEKGINLVLKEWESLKNSEITNIPQHCDFSFANLLFNKETLKIIDWEDFGKTRLPLYDVITLVNSLYFNPKAFEKHLVRNKINEIVRANVINYCDIFRVDKKFMQILFPTSLIILFDNCHSFKTREIKYKLLEYYFERKESFFTIALD